MNVFKRVGYRIYQGVFALVLPMLPWRQPQLLEGEGSLSKLAPLLKEKTQKKVFVVTDAGLVKAGLLDKLENVLKDGQVDYVVYDKTVANPTIDNIEEALSLYKQNDCEAIVALGGGSSMDCAKGVGARVACPKKTIPQMKGVLKVGKDMPLFVAIPTTAGTGSECTIAAVITNSKTHEKYAVNDLHLIPHYAVLDPVLTEKLPKHITSTTGMDALTHAVEAFIGNSNTRDTKRWAIEAVQLIFGNLEKAYQNGSDLTARANMQRASYLAGLAFTRAYVGYVHAIAHTLGGFYNVPHGLANAVILPHVLRYYGKTAQKKLALLATAVGIEGSEEERAEKFVTEICEMNRRMDIPDKISGIKKEDIPTMVSRAYAEGNPLYPVPKFMDKKEFAAMYEEISAD